MRQMNNLLRYGSSFVAPIIAMIVLPLLIVWLEREPAAGEWLTPNTAWLVIGGVLILAGLILFLVCVRMFILIGRGTIMPWDPTRKLITASLYGYVRNPMILSILIVEVGEALLFASWGVAILALVFWIVNTVYFIYSEEPGLEKRFGQEYVEYKSNVPRWIPRLQPWHPA
jgi:protein-S-isoprenylcysteine O-methyltransferase Ste14